MKEYLLYYDNVEYCIDPNTLKIYIMKRKTPFSNVNSTLERLIVMLLSFLVPSISTAGLISTMNEKWLSIILVFKTTIFENLLFVLLIVSFAVLYSFYRVKFCRNDMGSKNQDCIFIILWKSEQVEKILKLANETQKKYFNQLIISTAITLIFAIGFILTSYLLFIILLIGGVCYLSIRLKFARRAFVSRRILKNNVTKNEEYN